MGHNPGNRVRMPENQHNNQCIRLRPLRLEGEGAEEPIVSIWFLFSYSSFFVSESVNEGEILEK